MVNKSIITQFEQYLFRVSLTFLIKNPKVWVLYKFDFLFLTIRIGPMKFKIFTYEMLIKEKHLDTFGHVNNATYFELLEEARWDFITNNG